MWDSLNAWAEGPLTIAYAIVFIGVLYGDAYRKDRVIEKMQQRISDLERTLDYLTARQARGGR